MASKLCMQTDDGVVEFPCEGITTVGRVKPNDVIVPDPKASRHHAMLRMLGDGRFYLLDLGSSNGTFVNGRRIAVPHELADGDEIKIGERRLSFHSQRDAVDEADAGSFNTIGQSTVLTVGGVVEQITILVLDVRNFTPLSESIPADQLAAVMGSLFQEATQVVERYGGVVDKFIGDAVMARWVAQQKRTGQSVLAALSSVAAIEEAIHVINGRFPDLPHPLRFGVGINSGQAVLGTVGASTRREYTALGDAVNLAFRLESATKELETDIVIGSDSYRYLPRALWENCLRTVTVKGKSRPQDVWTLTFGELTDILPRLAS